ncbi:MAG: hypothetical protein Q9M19_02725 [Mariprofundaceae bacterium]|nr:hypothetical protein [Mariprofundaceae bacterium]
MTKVTADNINQEKDVILNETSGKKSRWKRNLVLILLLMSAMWAFWTYSPIVVGFKAQFLAVDSLPVVQSENEPVVSSVAVKTPIFAKDMRSLPTFEVLTEKHTGLETTAAVELQKQNQDNQGIQDSLVALQQQVTQLNTQLNDLQHQQIQQTQMQVRGQLFAALVQAASAQSALKEMILAWKSITFMPLLNEEKRDFAREAVLSLQDIQQLMLAEQQEVTLLLQALTQALSVDVLPVSTSQPTKDTYQMVSKRTWMDWLSAQFQVSKVQPSSSKEDPHRSSKQLIHHLQQYQYWIAQEQWQQHFTLAHLVYQLEQRGIETSLSSHDLPQAQIEIVAWQEQANVWMQAL